MGGSRQEGHYTDSRNERMEERSRRERRMEASSERGQGAEGAVAPCMDWTWKHKSEQLSSMNTQATEHCSVCG